nr:hypothetical protein [Tanacetum cinerariifolium]
MKVKQSLIVTFNESPPPRKLSPLVDDDVSEEEAIRNNTKVVNNNNKEEDESIEVDKVVNIKESKNHTIDQVIGNLNQRTLRSQAKYHSNFFCFISTVDPKDMDVKSAFLNGFINEEVYIAQPLGFIEFQKPNYVYKLKKALYGLKHAPKSLYDRLKAFLIKHEYSMGIVENTLFTKKPKSHLIIVQIYVDDIIFGFTSQNLCDHFAKIMHDEFEMSIIGDLNFFLGLQIKQMEDEIFFTQSKYIKEMLKSFGLEDSKQTKTSMSTEIKLTKDDEANFVGSSKYRENPKTTHLEAVKRIFKYVRGTTHLGLWYPKRTRVETIVYVDYDHTGDYVDRKSTSGICMFMGCCLTSWFAKKKTALAISTTESEYVSARKACQQALWMKHAPIDYDIRLDDVPITCENKSAIDLSTKIPSKYQQDYKKIRAYAPQIYNDPNMIEELRDIYMALESRYIHEGRTIDLSFCRDLSDDSKAKFANIGFDCLLSLDEKICPRKISFLKAKQPKKPPPKRTRNVGKSKHVELTTSSSTESPPSDNRDLPSTKLSPISYSRALKDDPNMSKE